ncbi:MAG: hypothetical protein NG747_13380 [Candidatus Brocadia sp.]|nr:hypothetical protein [Candidatus Brocadia sp.]
MDKRIKLIQWAEQQLGKPFEWGKADCTTVTLEGMKLYYGKEIPINIGWGSLKDALRAYKKYGSPPDILRKHGFIEITRNFEQTGDIFLWHGHGYWLLGVIISGSVLVADEGKAIEMRPIRGFTGNYYVFGVR